MHKSTRLIQKQADLENDAQMDPKVKYNIPNIAAMDTGTMVEALKFLNYNQLAKNSLLTKRFRNLIQTHRHSLALLDVEEIFMNSADANQEHVVIKMFNKELSPEEYKEWIVRNGYSQQIPLDVQIAGKENTENGRDISVFGASVYQNPNRYHYIAKAIFRAHSELKDEKWPLFQHFIRLLMDPFIYIRTLLLTPQEEVFSLLAGAIKPDRDRLQCKQLIIRFNNDTKKFTGWIKDYVRSDEFLIYMDSDSNYDEEFLDLFLTGARCTSAINFKYYDLSKVIVDLIQKFMSLKNRDEYQVIESTRGYVEDRKIAEAVKRNCAEFIAEEEQYKESRGTRQVIRFINNDIEKKLTLRVRNFSSGLTSIFLIKITNL